MSIIYKEAHIISIISIMNKRAERTAFEFSCPKNKFVYDTYDAHDDT